MTSTLTLTPAGRQVPVSAEQGGVLPPGAGPGGRAAVGTLPGAGQQQQQQQQQHLLHLVQRRQEQHQLLEALVQPQQQQQQQRRLLLDQ